MEWHELPKYNGIQVSQLIYGSILMVVLFLCNYTMYRNAMPRTLYITVLPYYRYSFKIHTMHDISRKTQGHVAHSLAASEGLE